MPVSRRLQEVRVKDVLELEVRPYECDSYGHVNHSVYVNYLEYARLKWLHAAGWNYEGLLAAGYFTYITGLEIRYRAQARCGDVLRIESEPSELRRVSGSVRQVIYHGETVVAEATVHWCLADSRGRPSRPPEGFDLGALGPS